jgi:4-hydroxy-tetrahydrodipicolinate synthase
MLSGSIVALVTPFNANGLDEIAMKRLVRFYLDNGTHPIVPTGTTGESPTLTPKEHARVIELVVYEVSGDIPVLTTPLRVSL